jgi:hypothetical protein
VDEEIVRALRTLDERVRGVAAAQSTLAAELRRLREALPAGAEDTDPAAGDASDPGRPLRDGGRVPPSPGS